MDTRQRLICDQCGYIVYQNPKLVVGALIEHDDRIVLVRRGIEPRRGYWGLPAGYLELGETVEAGATREAHEETGYQIVISRLLNLYTRVEAGIVNVFYLARIVGGHPRLSEETLDIDL
ncbi:MAG: NUDIX domain-containing protein, partial [Dehalococcoidia bacterium]|nr:NUDIX domain-containing protein [Dehalococcoidia bacterium]